MYPQKGFFEKILEGAALLALAAYLIRYAVLTIKSVWGWIILLAVIAGAVVVAIRLYRHYKERNF